MKQINFLAEDNRLVRLSQMGDPLKKVAASINFEQFRPLLSQVFPHIKGEKGGRPAWDNVLMFKIMLLQQWYNIADDMTEYLINDRLSFQRFLNFSLGDKVPDAKTIWLYKEILKNSGNAEKLFYHFTQSLEEKKVVTRKGSIVDASFVDVPKQRNCRDENKQIKNGKKIEEWTDSKRCQKDVDARWTKKNNETHFGYKTHTKVDKDSKLIVSFSVTDASVHDSQEIVKLIDKKDENLWGDSAYASKELREKIKQKNKKIKLYIHEKGYRGKPLTEEQKARNKELSKTRARVEHIFGFMTGSMGGMYSRVIGFSRNEFSITMKNLAYNLKRFTYLNDVKKAKGVVCPVT